MKNAMSPLSKRRGPLLWALSIAICPRSSVAQFHDCTGTVSKIGDGECDSANNLPVCQYDGGDCCTSTGEISRDWVIRNSKEAADLARSLVCSDGEFAVDWIGEVTVTDVIWVSNGTTLKVSGGTAEPTPIVDGNGESQLFSVIGGFLDLNHLELNKGIGTLGGAVFVGKGGVATFTGASFKGNTASERGGALFVDGGANVSWKGKSIFSDNSARNGGAVHVSGGSSVSWAGDEQTLFYRNKAEINDNGSHRGQGDVRCTGGALSLDEKSRSFWSSSTVFRQNTACDCGGAIYSGESSFISWKGETNIIYNTAPMGGGVCLRSFSRVSWTSTTLLSDNSAINSTNGNGGAVYATNGSSVSWDGDELTITTIANNTAKEDGGGISLAHGSNLSYSGETKFLSNSADDGGAFALGLACSVSYNGSTLLENNYASSDGGAVYASLIGDNGITNISINGATRFHNNSCGEYGGALMLGGSAFVAFGSVPVTFEKNKAESSGGAVFLSGVGIGPIFTGVNFTDNCAQVGGAVYSTGSGTTFVEGKTNAHATVYERCTFARNEARATGGAMESAAGIDVVKNSTFSQNRAQKGGALRLAGVAQISQCLFEKNRAEEESGPAVSTVGFASQMANCSFSDNVFMCSKGKYLSFEKVSFRRTTVVRATDEMRWPTSNSIHCSSKKMQFTFCSTRLERDL